MTDLREKVEKELEVNLSGTEWINLEQYFKSKQFLHETNITNIATEEAAYIADKFLRTLQEKFKIDLSYYPASIALLVVSPKA
jgi:lichenan operon transcriptional antiterminator